MKSLPYFAGLLYALSSICPAARADHTNVVIIYADDLGYGDLGCYGHPKFRTPNLDRMATEGARLTDFYVCAPNCTPSRAGLLTGRYQFRVGLPNVLGPEAKIGIADSEVTLGDAFKAAGYATACVGKWHLGHLPQFRPTRHGFDQYTGILYSNDMHPVELWRCDRRGDEMIEYPVDQNTLTRAYTQIALDFIERNQDRPFFLYFPEVMVHKPLAASQEFYKKSGAGLYGDAVAELDWSVGQVLGKLDSLGLAQNTLVLFSSDNGPWYGGSTGGLRGMKGTTWDGGIREPLIARWPGKIPAGHVSHEPAIIMDLFATALKAAGVEPPKDRVIDGKDIMPLLTSDAPSPHEAIFSYHAGQIRTVRSGRWKLHVAPPEGKNVRYYEPGDEYVDARAPDGKTILAPFEQAHGSEYPGVKTGDPFDQIALFDIAADAAEKHNVADNHPEVVSRLRGYHEKVGRHAALWGEGCEEASWEPDLKTPQP